jgi:NADPH2:quinone reductase
MRAVGYRTPGGTDRTEALRDIELPDPTPGERDLLVEVRAVSVNPVDTKVRNAAAPPEGEWKVLGWDAAGVVRAVGGGVTGFKTGDEVFYAGAVDRPGCDSALHLVDARIVGHKPRSLDWAQAAGVPLTALTAWEMLFDRLEVKRPVGGAANAILILGAAGGVGSIAVQLARRLTDLTVIATASRVETTEWVRELGAHHVLDHSKPLAPQVADLGLGAPAFVFSVTHSDQHLPDAARLIAPQGRYGLIDDPPMIDAKPLMSKSVSLHWELMFTRSLFGTHDIATQGEILDQVSRLIDQGVLKTTVTETLSPINAANLRKAHAAIESHRTRGKIALEGWD